MQMLTLDMKTDDNGSIKSPPNKAMSAREPYRAHNESIAESLYNLDKQKRAKREAMAEKFKKDEEDKLKKAKEKAHNPESMQHTGQKFEKHFNAVIEAMQEHEAEWDPDQLISYDQAGSICVTMGFLKEKDFKLPEEVLKD